MQEFLCCLLFAGWSCLGGLCVESCKGFARLHEGPGLGLWRSGFGLLFDPKPQTPLNAQTLKTPKL